MMEILYTLVQVVSTMLIAVLQVALGFALVLIGFATAIGILIYVLWNLDDFDDSKRD